MWDLEGIMFGGTTAPADNRLNPDVTWPGAVNAGNSDELQPGETVRFIFNIIDIRLAQEIQTRAIKARLLDKFPQLKILGDYIHATDSSSPYSGKYTILARVRYPEELPVEIQGMASPLVVGLIAATVAGGGIIFYMTLDKVEKITDSPAGQAAMFGAGAAGIGVAVVAAIVLIGILRR